MRVRDVMRTLPLSVKRNYRDRRTGEIIDYDHMDRNGKGEFRSRTVYLMSPVNEKEMDIFVY